MSDKELLEKAALAAGVALHWINGLPKEITEHWSGNPEEGPQEREWDWNPLTDDGDTFRLLCQRSMRIVEDRGGAYRAVQFTVNPEADDESIHEIEIEWPHTPAATRRAIVRAAAALAGDREQS